MSINQISRQKRYLHRLKGVLLLQLELLEYSMEALISLVCIAVKIYSVIHDALLIEQREHEVEICSEKSFLLEASLHLKRNYNVYQNLCSYSDDL